MSNEAPAAQKETPTDFEKALDARIAADKSVMARAEADRYVERLGLYAQILSQIFQPTIVKVEDITSLFMKAYGEGAKRDVVAASPAKARFRAMCEALNAHPGKGGGQGAEDLRGILESMTGTAAR